MPSRSAKNQPSRGAGFSSRALLLSEVSSPRSLAPGRALFDPLVGPPEVSQQPLVPPKQAPASNVQDCALSHVLPDSLWSWHDFLDSSLKRHLARGYRPFHGLWFRPLALAGEMHLVPLRKEAAKE
jgi:hypothetical protein